MFIVHSWSGPHHESSGQRGVWGGMFHFGNPIVSGTTHFYSIMYALPTTLYNSYYNHVQYTMVLLLFIKGTVCTLPLLHVYIYIISTTLYTAYCTYVACSALLKPSSRAVTICTVFAVLMTWNWHARDSPQYWRPYTYFASKLNACPNQYKPYVI